MDQTHLLTPSVSHGKAGNHLLARLGAIFEEEYLTRQGKVVSIRKKRERILIDYSSRDFSTLSYKCGEQVHNKPGNQESQAER